MRAFRSSVGLAGVFVLTACVDAIPTMPGVKPGVLPIAPTATFTEDFSASTLDPAWTVVPGARFFWGYGLPVNDYSLTANPGHLRYTLNPMSHQWGFMNGYTGAPVPQLNTVYPYDLGLELWRPITGDHWLMEAKATFYLPCVNGRAFHVFAYFGSGGTGTTAAGFGRHRDTPLGCTVGGNSFSAMLVSQPGTTAGDLVYDPAAYDAYPLNGPDYQTIWMRLERAGGVLTWSQSNDGAAWVPMFTKDLGTALDGLPQRVTIVGHSWFVTGGSYADWDYVNVTSTVIPVDIDIMPGSHVNPINLNRHGKIPVAILSSAEFDAPTAVDRSSLTFGHAGTETSLSHCNAEPEDVNGDLLPDLLCHFEATVAGFLAGDVAGYLRGSTTGGQPISGSDAITIR
jgi:hypothetical protein